VNTHAGSAPGTIRALQAALTAEHAAIYGYGVVGAYLTGSAQATAATTGWLAHQVARDHLEAVLRSLGAQPAAAAVAYQLPAPVHNTSEAVALAIVLEERIATAYLGLVALSNESIRDYGARQVQASALRAAAWRGGTVAFPGMTSAALARSRKRS
jgi:Domain of unknown function (DUF4439)